MEFYTAGHIQSIGTNGDEELLLVCAFNVFWCSQYCEVKLHLNTLRRRLFWIYQIVKLEIKLEQLLCQHPGEQEQHTHTPQPT